MKIIKNTTWLFVLAFICSCGSDNLSNSKAEDIISDCLDKEPEKRTATLNINQVTFGTNNDKLERYKELEEDGFIEMEQIDMKSKIKKSKPNANDPLAQWRYEAELRRAERNKNTFKVTITKKAEKYIDEAKENSNWIKMKAYSYEVDEVLEVQEIPSLNSSKVKVKYEAVDITPFAILSKKDPSEFWIKDITMTKTSNGWKYCDNF